ncbi:helix-turn-helix transcriptional regulator [Stappia sp. 28M-7]|uniref:helix-turn-helix domain-containing protein n=1 Tax=Stappia sp. 28M-7 TaxID=2762596 RepID=UPI000FF72054|nr:helix-turn-helix transcriptional regulator [Stappia sp. 28M-7]
MAPPALTATMTPELFRKWRKSLGLKQKDAAEVLGLKKRMIQYYEKGDRNGRPVEIPKAVRLACYALTAGIADFDGLTPVRGPVQPASPPAAGRPARAASDPGAGT